MNNKIEKIIFNRNLRMPCNLYNKYIIESKFYIRITVYFGFRNKYISNAKELYNYYIFLSCVEL